MKTTVNHTVPAINFINIMMANIDNEKLNDAEFRQFIRKSLPIIEKPALSEIVSEPIKEKIKKFYTDEPK